MANRKHDCWVKVAEGELCMKPSVVLHRAPVAGFPMSTALNYYCAEHKHLIKTNVALSAAAAKYREEQRAAGRTRLAGQWVYDTTDEVAK